MTATASPVARARAAQTISHGHSIDGGCPPVEGTSHQRLAPHHRSDVGTSKTSRRTECTSRRGKLLRRERSRTGFTATTRTECPCRKLRRAGNAPTSLSAAAVPTDSTPATWHAPAARPADEVDTRAAARRMAVLSACAVGGVAPATASNASRRMAREVVAGAVRVLTCASVTTPPPPLQLPLRPLLPLTPPMPRSVGHPSHRGNGPVHATRRRRGTPSPDDGAGPLGSDGDGVYPEGEGDGDGTATSGRRQGTG